MSASPPSSLIWDVIRYGIVAVGTGVLIWFYFFYTPTEYVSREHTGSTQDTPYIVKVARFPDHADWNQLAESIRHRLDALEQTDPEDIVRTVQSAFPAELAIDLAAVAQGVAIDSIAELLEQHGIEDYLIELGNSVRSKGQKGKDRDRDWLVGIEKPGREFSGIHRTLALHNQSFATVGDDDHSVTVIASSSASANAWASAMLVLGKQRGRELAEQQGLAVLFLLRSGGEIEETASKGWAGLAAR
ncbi:MAG: FAD:protein FMN transferase [Planctomycetaceae bacterium]|nr:FAD:protein FMN transferase [Planctomycetaceae bacterium]